MLAAFSGENIGKRFEADAREELYRALLGKSQTFHDRQRVGDIMARATDDVSLLSSMVVPGTTLIIESSLATIIPLILIANIRPDLLLVPALFLFALAWALRGYVRQLDPVTTAQREQFGKMNAGLEETISGIEIVKASARELFEREKFFGAVQLARDLFVKQGYIEARYLPLLLYALAFGQVVTLSCPPPQVAVLGIPAKSATMNGRIIPDQDRSTDGHMSRVIQSIGLIRLGDAVIARQRRATAYQFKSRWS